MRGTILIVEDERDLSETLEYALPREGFATRTAGDGRTALGMVGEAPAPDLVLLDLMLPDISGFEVCRQLRDDERTRPLPIIMMSACAEDGARAAAFEAGADDYVIKPFSLRELASRCRAVLRRRARIGAEPGVQHGRLRIDGAGHRVWVDGDEVRLSPLEFRLLATLTDHCGRVQTRDSLIAAAWQAQPGLTTRSVDAHIERLRDKLGGAAEHVRTLRGVGYRFAADSHEQA